MAFENQRPPNPNRLLDTIQVMLVPISIGVSIILGQTQVPGLVLTASYTFTGGNLAVLVFRKMAGLLMASVLGWTGFKNLDKLKSYYEIKQIFPVKTTAVQVLDGDTFTAKNGLTVRLLGINAPDRGKQNYQESSDYLSLLILNKKLTFEYDKYQDDKFGRILAYVWIDCTDEIRIFCHDDKALVNEVMVKNGFAVGVIYDDRKKLKYQDLLNP